MRANRMQALSLSLMTAILGFCLTGCPSKGPAEKVGEKIDHAKDKVSDALDPKGPAEKAGRAIDRAVND